MDGCNVSEKIIAVIGVGFVFAIFFGTLIYSELVTDENRFLITDLGSIRQTITGQPFNYPDNPPNIDVLFIEILPHAESGWHTHSTPMVVTVLHGELEVYYCTDETDDFMDECDNTLVNHYTTGDVFVEAINTKHNGVNEGVIPVKLHVITLN